MIALLDDKPIPIKINIDVEPDFPARRSQPPRYMKAVRIYELDSETPEPVYRFVRQTYEWAES